MSGAGLSEAGEPDDDGDGRFAGAGGISSSEKVVPLPNERRRIDAAERLGALVGRQDPPIKGLCDVASDVLAVALTIVSCVGSETVRILAIKGASIEMERAMMQGMSREDCCCPWSLLPVQHEACVAEDVRRDVR